MSIARDDRVRNNAMIREKFLDLTRPIDRKYISKNKKDGLPYGYIYCIENKLNGKKYIGATYSRWEDVVSAGDFPQLKKRASQYIYEYNDAKEMKSSMRKHLRPIIQAMVEDGIENFVMYPIAETEQSYHKSAEAQFIRDLNTIENGYNVDTGGGGIVPGCYRPPHSAAAKKARSSEVICINLNEKKIMYSDSMKLFADYMGTTKDMIKNVVRICSQYKGWFIFYTDWESRNNVITNLLNNTGVFATRKTSDKTKAFYKEFHENLGVYLTKPNSEFFSDFEILKPLKYE